MAFDYDPRVSAERAQFEAAAAILTKSPAGVELVSLAELLDQGDAAEWRAPPAAPEGIQRIALVVHSSGSTGQPKGRTFTSGWP